MALAALNILPSAPYRDSCLIGTRVEILQEISTWIVECKSEILWLKGMAGSGKSTLASTIADHARAMGGDHGRLGAFIRFDRNEIYDASRVITTLAWCLASFDDRIGEVVMNVTKRYSDINTRPFSEQFKKLILDPLLSLEILKQEGPIIVLLDALDECGVLGKRTALLDVLSSGFGKRLPMMRLIITSRAEQDIVQAFNPEKRPHIFTLPLDIRSTSGDADIRMFLQKTFSEIPDDEFQALWRKKDACTLLAQQAGGHFIWASTACEFIKEYPVARLNDVLEARNSVPASSDAETDLDSLYKIALASSIGPRRRDIKSDVRSLLGTVIVAKEPLSISTLDILAFGSGSGHVRSLRNWAALPVSRMMNLFDFFTSPSMIS